MVIVSTVSGRIRVRSRRLKSRKTSRNVGSRLEQLEGVSEVHLNPAAGSVTVLFDADKLDVAVLEEQIEQLCEPLVMPANNTTARARAAKMTSNATNVGMLATLGASVVYGFLGQKKLHILLGTGFMVLAGLHTLRNSNRLIQ